MGGTEARRIVAQHMFAFSLSLFATLQPQLSSQFMRSSSPHQVGLALPKPNRLGLVGLDPALSQTMMDTPAARVDLRRGNRAATLGYKPAASAAGRVPLSASIPICKMGTLGA